MSQQISFVETNRNLINTGIQTFGLLSKFTFGNFSTKPKMIINMVFYNI